MTKQTIIEALKSAQKSMKKHSPEILTGIGIAGMIATTVSAVRATPKALQLIDAREIKENRRLSNKEIVATTWKCYVPAAVTGVLSTACLVGASSANLRRNTALATAYSISETALKEYKEKAVEVVGEKKSRRFVMQLPRRRLRSTLLANARSSLPEVAIFSASTPLQTDISSPIATA